ncbi:Rv1733c family protein [Streptomyces sp. NPDC001002]
MRKAGRGTVLAWRWRRNPLRRRSDVVEAWILLAACVLATVSAVLAGVVGTQAAERALARDRAARTPVAAVLVRIVPGSTRDVVTGIRHDRAVGSVRWTDAKGVVRTGLAPVRPGTEPGSPVRAWTDGHGRLVPAPVNAGEASARAALSGAGAALLAGSVVLVGGHLVRLRVQRRATERWGAEWERVSRHWGHTTG